MSIDDIRNTQSDEVGEGGTKHKRRKIYMNGNIKHRPRTSRIFTPFRALGLVSCTSVPFTSIPLGKTTFQLTTSVGRCLHTYDLRKGLNLVFLTRPETPTEITSTFAWKDQVFAAWGGSPADGDVGMWTFKRGKKVEELAIPTGSFEPITQILIFGSWILGCRLNQIEVWKSTNYEHYTTLMPASPRGLKSGGALSGGLTHMPTYLNKIMVGKSDGSVEIWNLNTAKLIYTILPASSFSGAVTALQPAPALSLLAIARADGSITIHDINADKVVSQLNTKSSHSSVISTISFRTDGLGAGEDGTQAGIMATAGTQDGDVTFWDLNRGGRISGVLRGAHDPPSPEHGGIAGGINKIEFLPGQNVIITSGLDNALKSWIFDATSLLTAPRILHSRSGHGAPVTRLMFVPTNADGADAVGKWLLSAGRDQSLWGWSLRRDGQSTELSQGNVRKKAKKLGLLGKSLDLDSSTKLEDLKAPEITCVACSLNRDGGMGAFNGGGTVWTNLLSKKESSTASASAVTGWESVITGHRGDKYARTWFWGRKRAGRWAFETADGAEVTSVAITTCGTFALVGSARGSISMFNLQSGILRQRFPPALTHPQAKKLKTAHENLGVIDGPKLYNLGEGKHRKAVSGLMVDSLNRTVISSGLDGKLKFWEFSTGSLQYELDWQSFAAITGLRYYRSSDLIALSCDDLAIRVVDTETKKVVRELWGSLGQINDFCFSNDGRWIIVASMDSLIRVWDLPTGHLINAVRMQSPCTALAMSETGEYLATAHADGIGINLWNNCSLFTHVPTRVVGEDETMDAIAPTTSGEGGQHLLSAAFSGDEEDPQTGEIEDGVTNNTSLDQKMDQLSSNLITLSLVPKSRWQTLVHLDTIAQRNKPKEPPKQPEKAPFFLASSLAPGPSSSTSGFQPQDPTSASSALPAERSRISKIRSISSISNPFTTLLQSSSETGLYEPFIAHLSSLSPAAADIEIRSLSPMLPDNDDNDEQPPSSASSFVGRGQSSELTLFVRALTARLRQKRDYELVNAWMTVFLKVHGESVVEDLGLTGGLREALTEWRTVQQEEATRLGEMLGFCKGVVGWLRSER